MHVHHDARSANRREFGHGVRELMLESLLDTAVNGERQRPTASCRVRKIFVERALRSGDAVTIDVGIAQYMGSKRSLTVEPVGLAFDGKSRLANGIDGFDHHRRRSPPRIQKRLTPTEQRE